MASLRHLWHHVTHRHRYMANDAIAAKLCIARLRRDDYEIYLRIAGDTKVHYIMGGGPLEWAELRGILSATQATRWLVDVNDHRCTDLCW